MGVKLRLSRTTPTPPRTIELEGDLVSSIKSDRRSKAIQRLVVGLVSLLMVVAVAGAVVNGALGLKAERARAAEAARDERVSMTMNELIATQKQIQLDTVQVQQFLTDVSATRGLNGLDDGWKHAADNAQAFRRDVARAKALSAQMGAPALANDLETVNEKFDAYYETGQRMAHAYVDKGPEGGNAMMPHFDATAEAITTAVASTDASLAALVKSQAALNQAIEDGLLAKQRQALALTAIAAMLTVAAGAAVIVLIRRKLLNPMAALQRYMSLLADGDYTREVPSAAAANELGDMARSIAVFRQAALERREARAAQEVERQEAERAKAERDTERHAQEVQRTQVVDALAEGLRRLSDGDVTYRIDAVLAAEYESLRADFNAAADKLGTAMRRIGRASTAVGVSADEIAAAADNLSQRTERQAASLEETAAALDEITATVRHTAGQVAEARDVITEAKGDAEHTKKVLSSTLTAVNEMATSSDQIGRIVGVIDEIAFQTNLLALNAGVEAARAGDAGRGFAVVASEVRALAQRSAEAAKEIKTLIASSSAKVTEGVEMVDETGQAIARILERVESISRIVMAISASASEQAAGLGEVNIAVNDMDRVTQQNAAMVEETTAAVHTLKAQYAALSQQVSSFRLGPAGGGVGRRAA